MSKVLVIAPHPDDETLGCGGTLFRHKQKADELNWVIVTGISEENGWSAEAVEKRDAEIDTVAKKYEFADIDKIIEVEEKNTIKEIFKNKGENYFREIEKKITFEELKKNNLVIALGGGTFIDKFIRKEIKSYGYNRGGRCFGCL